MMCDPSDSYTREELEYLVDHVIEFGGSFQGFIQYRIRGIYVSPSVVLQCMDERLERMLNGVVKESQTQSHA